MVDNPKLKPPQTLTGKTQTPGDLCVCVCVYRKRTWTFYIHEVRVGTLNKTLLLVPPLLLLRGRVQQVFCELQDLRK